MKLLEGKNILITGASRGIGNGIAVTLASHGANIFFTYVNSKDSAIALEEKIQNITQDFLEEKTKLLENISELQKKYDNLASNIDEE